MQCRHVACGARHTVAVTQGGEVFAWGWSGHGQTGTVATVCQPSVIAALQGLRCSRAAAGLAHTVICTDDGACYSLGWNSNGQLGTGSLASTAAPTLVQGQAFDDEHVVQVCAHVCACACTAQQAPWTTHAACYTKLRQPQTAEA